MQNFFVKSHGLGNDYIVLNQNEIEFELTKKAIVKICDVHYGIGSDGIFLKVPSFKADFGLRILNPDGSEAEKSGNGLRIFAKYLYDYQVSRNQNYLPLKLRWLGPCRNNQKKKTEKQKPLKLIWERQFFLLQKFL